MAEELKNEEDTELSQPEYISDIADREQCDSPSQLTAGMSEETAEEDLTQSETVTEIPVPEQNEAPAELTKKELRQRKKAEKKAKRQERRDTRVGIPVWLVLLIAVGINAYWYYTIEYRYEPKVQETYAQYESVIEEYKRQIKAQDVIWRNREEYWQKEIDSLKDKTDELQTTYEIIMRDLGFEIDAEGNAYKPGE